MQRHSSRRPQSQIVSVGEPLKSFLSRMSHGCRMAAAPVVQQEKPAVDHLSAALAACPAHVALNG